MSLKLKVLGMGLLAVMATSAFAVMNASANGSGGHFVSDVDHTIINAVETGEHKLDFRPHGGAASEQIGCDVDVYTGTTTTKTTESITIQPHYSNCYTTGNGTGVTIDPTGCHFTFTVTKETNDQTEQQVHLTCGTPEGPNAVTITHPNCTITVPPQTVNNAVTYTNKVDPTTGKHFITLDVNATFNTEYHGGICVFLGTSQRGELIGSVTVTGEDTLGNKVNVTAT